MVDGYFQTSFNGHFSQRKKTTKGFGEVETTSISTFIDSWTLFDNGKEVSPTS